MKPASASPRAADAPSRRFDGPGAGPAATRSLAATWADPPGFVGALCAIDPKTIARRFMATTLAFFLLGGGLALVMRLQLARPHAHLVDAQLYNQLFTVHGSTMMYLFAVPVMQAVAIYLVPLMIGTRSIAFPRMNAYAFWIFLMGGLFLYGSFAAGAGPSTGWFSYVPLASADYSPGKGPDVWAQTITFTELSALLEAIVLITTIFKMRAPGMSLSRMPLFVWAVLVTQFMVLFAMPAIMVASTTLILDRLVGTHFFNPAHDGDVLLFQHLFWFFGHPEVYLIFVPALGFMSSIISTCTRRPIFGYRPMVLSLVATAFLAFGLWVHHMFATPLPEVGKSFFTAASLAIAVPGAVQIFCWLATLWGAPLLWRTQLLFALAFFVILVVGGLSGIMLAAVPIDLQVHDTYFVVAHLHYVLFGGAVFPLFGAFYHWFPKFSGRLLDERLGRWHFALLFVGFNTAFFPMHLLGLQGMVRRIWTYPEGMGWDRLNLLSTIGAWIIALGTAVFLVNLVRSLRSGVLAGRNPWNAGTLEWHAASPPPPHNFDSLPVVHGKEPLWDARGPGGVSGLAADARELLITRTVDARPEGRYLFPSPSIWPFATALATTVLFIASVFTPWGAVWGAVPLLLATVAWFWPRRAETQTAIALERAP
ncbi:cbb3-type cytochrome c oxidase subunit I [Variovorax soli]|uniref:Cytochrome c oxidase subunit 1 n=1 Tax=Variovorax soli TaxID=376815 RepID=A0ABU1NDM0_9BURK|nr:cbb3-type cytochrome c oxidase subunit I [Variovorax soli]MDR6536559.1 cytochrome c oxidase subunit 1 [Variovorax soli]